MGISFVEKGKNVSDVAAIERIKSGDYEYLNLLIDRYMPIVVKCANDFSKSGVDKEDLISVGISAIFDSVRAFDDKKARFNTFLTLCVKRAMISLVRKNNAEKRIPKELISSIEDVELVFDETPEDVLINKESFGFLRENILSELSDLEYKVLALLVSGDSYAEISEKLNISLKSVDNSLSRIRNKMKDYRR